MKCIAKSLLVKIKNKSKIGKCENAILGTIRQYEYIAMYT